MTNEENSMIIWKDTDAIIKQKCHHCKRKGMRKYLRRTGFGVFNGDVPVVEIMTNGTHRLVLNNRGLAYAHRNALRYRKTKREKLYSIDM